MISRPQLRASPCSRCCQIVSVLKYNQVAENSYGQQFNFVRRTIYINEMISISEHKLICKYGGGEGWWGGVEGWQSSQVNIKSDSQYNYLQSLVFMWFVSNISDSMVQISLVNGCYRFGQQHISSPALCCFQTFQGQINVKKSSTKNLNFQN